MSLSNVNLKKQWTDFFKRNKNITQKEIDQKTKKCEELFEKVHYCVQKHGWNDNHCQLTIKPKYDRCIMKRVRLFIKKKVQEKMRNDYLEKMNK